MTTANIDAFIVAGGLSPWLKSYAAPNTAAWHRLAISAS